MRNIEKLRIGNIGSEATSRKAEGPVTKNSDIEIFTTSYSGIKTSKNNPANLNRSFRDGRLLHMASHVAKTPTPNGIAK
jgi:hypothetical protein